MLYRMEQEAFENKCDVRKDFNKQGINKRVLMQ
jgi:hypothetical protein